MGYKIVLEFENASDAFDALRIIGDLDDAWPINQETSTFEMPSGAKYNLWKSFDGGIDRIDAVDVALFDEYMRNNQNGTNVG